MDLVTGLVVWMAFVAALLGAWRGEEDSLVGSSRLEKKEKKEQCLCYDSFTSQVMSGREVMMGPCGSFFYHSQLGIWESCVALA